LRDAFHSRPPHRPGLGRWLAALPLDKPEAFASRGEGATPLIEEAFGRLRVRLLLDHLNPSGSYKDRGAAVMLADLHAQGAHSLVEDSSGNAGIALALYASARRTPVTVFVPSGIPRGKRRLIERFGGRVITCAGSSALPAREAAARAAREASRKRGRAYASHVWQPAFHHGVKTAAYEIAAAVGRPGPSGVVFPVGNGALALGLALGFSDLVTAGLLDRPPVLLGVQAAACAPVAREFAESIGGRRPRSEPGGTACDGIRIASPPLAREIVVSIAGSGGVLVAVKEAETRRAQDQLWRRGYAVELTSAVVAAALSYYGSRWEGWLESLGLRGPIVGLLTGSGLKSSGVAG
jgi:threonine synthase